MASPLLSISDLALNLGDRWLLRHVSLVVSPGDRLAFVGRNGAGKSSLMKLIAGYTEPDEGSRWCAPYCSVAYLPQNPSFKASMSLSSYVLNGLVEEPQMSVEDSFQTWAATLYSSTNGSLVKCNISWSSVDSETSNPRLKYLGKGDFEKSRNNLLLDNGDIAMPIRAR